MARMSRPIAIAAMAWTIAGAATAAPAAAGWIAVGAWTLTLSGLLVLRRPGSGRRLIAALVIAMAAGAAIASHVALTTPTRAAAASLAVDGGRAIDVQAVVVSKSHRISDGTVMFDARTRIVRLGQEEHRIRVPVTVRASTSPSLGATVSLRGTGAPAHDGDRAAFVVRARAMRVLAPAPGVVGASVWLRHGLAEATAGLPEPAAGLIPGLAVGDTAGVADALDSAMKASSLSHLTAVSGANCAIVVGLSFGLAAWCGARRGTRVAVGMVALGGFVLLVTPEPSVVRAAAMAAIAMLGVLLGRTGGGMALLCVAVTVVLAIDPWLAGSIGFALSAGATAALLVLAAPLATGLMRIFPRFLALALGVPLAAQLVCGPLLILIDPTVPLYGVVANMLADPAAPVATIFGLAACLAAPFPLLCSGLTALTWVPAAWIASTAHLAVSLPGSSIAWPAGWLGAVLLSLLGAAIVVLIIPNRFGHWGRRLRSTAVVALTVTLGVGLGTSALRTVVGPLTVPDGWSIAACDVGQGDALLVRSAGATALIDTGPEPDPLRACLSRLGIDRVDLLVLTHYDLDHIGGLDAVADRTSTALVGPVTEAAGRRVRRELREAGADVVDARAGMSGGLGAATWTVLWPPEGSTRFAAGNPASVTVDIRGGGVPSSVFLGDLDASAQRALASSGALQPPYDVVKVAHHGSADQDPPLYRTLRPTVALISVGADNDYGHPRPRTLAFLKADGAVIARTDRAGLVTVRGGEERIGIWREHPATAEADTGAVAPAD